MYAGASPVRFIIVYYILNMLELFNPMEQFDFFNYFSLNTLFNVFLIKVVSNYILSLCIIIGVSFQIGLQFQVVCFYIGLIYFLFNFIYLYKLVGFSILSLFIISIPSISYCFCLIGLLISSQINKIILFYLFVFPVKLMHQLFFMD